MIDGLLFFVLQLHILAGIIAAFVAFPIAAFAKKQSKFHRFGGRLFVICFAIICCGGFLLEFENLQSSVVHIYGVDWAVSPFTKGEQMDYLAIINTAMVNTMAFYLAISGWRIWKRSALAKRDIFPLTDTLLALLYLLAGIIFSVTLWVAFDRKNEVEHLSHLEMELAHAIILAAASYVTFDAFRDLQINFTKKAPKKWWLIHARKMITAEMGLAAAFPYRCGEFNEASGLLMIASMVAALAIGGFVAQRYNRETKAKVITCENIEA